MITSDQVSKIMARCLPKVKRKAQAEIMIMDNHTAMTRFANNEISQNVSKSNCVINIKAIVGKRCGQMSINQLDETHILEAFDIAASVAKKVQPDKSMLPFVGKNTYLSESHYSQATATATPQQKAKILKTIVNTFKVHGARAVGTIDNTTHVLALYNTKGLRAFHRSTRADLDLTSVIEDGMGWAGDTKQTFSQLQVADVAERALDKALRSTSPHQAKSGKYTVVLEHNAACELIGYLGWMGFNGLAFNEKRSFLSGKIGKKVVGDNITITDDYAHPLMMGMPFDFEGTKRKRVLLIENGIARHVVHDRYSAKTAGVMSTGHSAPQPNAQGASPSNLILDPGNSSIPEMIASTKKGIYVTKFHYTNVIDPKRIILTGMTRNGTFLIENGKITKPLKNMRFTESALTALSNVDAITSDVKFVKGFFSGGHIVPALKIHDFTFSSGTKF